MIFLSSAFLFSCHNVSSEANENKSSTNSSSIKIPEFSGDSAYAYVAKQVSFGPRIPNTLAQEQCATWLFEKLKSFTPNVEIQETNVTGYDGTKLKCKNIIATINPENHNRIAIFSHWDTRPWADEDTSKIYHSRPFDGANDGPSGVGVILELARQMIHEKPEIGVTLVLLDVEDYGVSGDENSYCLGTQYWAAHFDKSKGIPQYGILLDMVGAPNSRFMFEAGSIRYARPVLEKVWKEAASLGYQQYFIPNETGGVTDDHVFINGIAQIPTIDIIDYDAMRNGGFGYYWHTHYDNMKVVDKGVLKSVGQTLLNVIFKEGKL